MRRIRSGLLALLLVALLLPNPSVACGCGLAIEGNSLGGPASPVSGDTVVFASLEHGTETLTFVRDFKRTSDHGKLLLVPIPARPEQATIEIVDETPTFAGVNVFTEAQEAVRNWAKLSFTTQIFPLAWYFITSPLNTQDLSSMPTSSTKSFGIADGAPQGVTVVEHIERNGLIAELISAETANNLAQYFQSKALLIAPAQLPALQEYIGKQSSFAAVWAAPNADQPVTPVASKKTKSGFTVTFPATTFTYPLRPNDGFGTTMIREIIYVAGFVQPQIPAALQPGSSVTYWHDSSAELTGAANPFLDEANGRFTTVRLNAASRDYTTDLVLSQRPLPRVVTADWIQTGGAAVTATLLALFVLLSWLAVRIAGRVALGSYVVPAFWLGLSNLLSVFGVMIATLITYYGSDPLAPRPSIWRQLGFVAIFSLMFCVLVFAARGIALWALQP